MTQWSRVAAAATVCLFVAATAFAQATRTWVSGIGDDVNPCSRTAPCKTFAGAISKTAAGGEINVLDDGGYGAVTITKSLTIDGGGHLASILGGTTGVVINAAVTDIVTIRRLQINGAPAGSTNGIRIVAAKRVNVEDSEVFGWDLNGIIAESASNAAVHISDSRFEDNGNAGIAALNGKVTVVGCSMIGNTFAGVELSGANTAMLISNSNLSHNGRGIFIASGTTRLTHNDIAYNTTWAWEIAGGVIETYVDNRIIGSGVGTLTRVQ